MPMASRREQPEYDVMIAGGGLVGASLAIALAPLSLRIGLVEAMPHDSAEQPSFDDRTIALSRGSIRILTGLGIWDDVAPHAWSIHRIHVSEQERFGTTVIDRDEQGIAELGCTVRARDLGRVLWEKLRAIGTLNTFCPARVTAATPASDRVQLEIVADGGIPSLADSRLLAVCDGARSALRSALGVDARVSDYDQIAIIGNVQVDARRAGHVAYERFTKAGPAALLPGRDGRYTFVLTRSTAEADEVLRLGDAEMLALLQDVFGFRLGRFSRVGRRQTYPLQLVKAESLTAGRAVIVGNAAHGLHPVAGQGFNLGLRDVAALAELIADAARDATTDFDAGAAGLLDRYSAWRKDDQRSVVAFTDGLIRLFGLDVPGAGTLRGAGLAAFDLLPGAKRALARHTMGLAGRLTRLARGMRL